MLAYSIDQALMLDDCRRAYEAKGFKAYTKPFRYSSEAMDGNDPAAGGDGNPTISICSTDADSLFIWTGIVAAGRDQDHASSYPSSSMAIYARIKVLGTDYPVTGSVFIPFHATTGVGEAPHWFSVPLVLVPSERVQIEIVGLEEPFRSLIVTLLGAKLYTTPFTKAIHQADHDYDLTLKPGRKGKAA